MNPGSVVALIALYERAVGIYASLININACLSSAWSRSWQEGNMRSFGSSEKGSSNFE
ncbi:Glucose-6-phosphate isomerase 1, chloroplastic [Apostasia shenzhenica]|uniref:Glucose-6-phosphate isomerase 1, chloroplastic n=1 Tax=Apostasia shenzhenica TaxID=1088818 RepID=A0A2I0AK55_9ASPA|nr:Glucose-6-phosphate isomerase 1, chloroplastic [Apostasia shenzhenica]